MTPPRPRILFGLLAVLLFGSSAASAQEVPNATPTAQDMYVACYLFTRQSDVPLGSDGKASNFGMAQCGGAALLALAELEGRTDREHRFCLPTTSQARSDPGTLMAYAYLDWFERRAANLSALTPQENNGIQAFAVAMLEEFPCA